MLKSQSCLSLYRSLTSQADYQAITYWLQTRGAHTEIQTAIHTFGQFRVDSFLKSRCGLWEETHLGTGRTLHMQTLHRESPDSQQVWTHNRLALKTAPTCRAFIYIFLLFLHTNKLLNTLSTAFNASNVQMLKANPSHLYFKALVIDLQSAILHTTNNRLGKKKSNCSSESCW